MYNSPDIFQEKMSEIFVGLDTVRVYIDDLLHVTKGSWTEHRTVIEEMFTRLQKAGLEVNARKYPIKRLQKLQISPRKLGSLVTHFHSELCLITVLNLWLNLSKMCQNYYVLKRKPITIRNPQSNAIVERIHQTIGNIIRTFDVSNIVNNDPWSGILAATMFSVRGTYDTTL